MGKVLVDLGRFDIIECPDRISENIEEYVEKFENAQKPRLYKYHTVDKKGNPKNLRLGFGLCYNTDDFVDWLNSHCVEKGEGKAVILRDDIEPTEEEYKLPRVLL